MNLALAIALTCTLHATDGDSARCGNERFRFMGYDTPELKGQCAYEIDLAIRAHERLGGLLAYHVRRGTAELVRTGKRDKYGRTLARLYFHVRRDGKGKMVSGKDVADIMIEEGLARSLKWDKGERRQGWC